MAKANAILDYAYGFDYLCPARRPPVLSECPVSILVAAADSHVGEPVTLADLRGYFHAAGKPRERWRIGAEYEKFGVDRATGSPLTYDGPNGIKALLDALATRHGWSRIHNASGHLTALAREGATISLEPGGQIELSTPPAATIAAIAEELDTHLSELRTVLPPARVAWLAAGVHPLAAVDAIPLMPRQRHAVMAEYLPRRSATALHMMKATASTQVAVDYADEADAMRKFTVALKLGPIVNAIWANGPLLGGQPTGVVTARGSIWQGMDPDRSGLLVDLLEQTPSFDRWVDRVIDTPMMFTFRDGQYAPAHGRTFRDFMNHGEDGYFPTQADWEIQLTTLFPEARLKRYLEVRGADAVARPLALAVPALWKGLLYDSAALDSASAVAATITPAELPELFELAFRRGLAARFHGRALAAWAADLLTLASQGLKRLGEPTRWLEPAEEVVREGRSPGMHYQERGPAADKLPEVLDWFEFR